MGCQKRFIVALLPIGVFLCYLKEPRAQSKELAPSPSSSEVAVSTRTLPIVLPSIGKLPFGPGERFVFVVKYQFINAGEATLEVHENGMRSGRPILSIISHAKSNSFIDVFFKVRDLNVSDVDALSMASVSFRQNLREGHFRDTRTTEVDYEKGTYRYDRIYKGIKSMREGLVNRPVSDILSSFYATRILPLERGKEYKLEVLSDNRFYFLRVEVGKKLEMIKVPAGRFECLRVRPFLLGDGIFKAKGGKLTIWLTNDEKKMPVLMRSKVFIGAIDVELVEYTFSSI